MRQKLFSFIILITGCFVAVNISAQDERILIPQTGFRADLNKQAVIRIKADSFAVTDLNGKVILKERLGQAKHWEFSDETVRIADISSIKAIGNYYLMIPGTDAKRLFGIFEDPYGEIANAAVKALYFNRCSYPILPEYGGKWARKAGHPDTEVYVHKSAASATRSEGFVISSPGGWYDAGDYNKYIVNSSISVYTMLLSYEMFPDYWKKRILNIPESSNNLPDVLDETLFNLYWMLTMQDDDGGVYHKCTELQFSGFEMPENTNPKRYVIQKNTQATLDFVATMAHASILFRNFEHELPGLADKCKNAAIKAWDWCLKNPAILYRQPQDVGTGGYSDRNLKDEWFWAGVEMTMLTGSAFPDSLLAKLSFTTPSWGDVAQLGMITALRSKDRIKTDIYDRCKKTYMDYASGLVEISEKAGYPVSLDFFNWGSNSDVANQGLLKIVAFSLTDDRKYIQSAINDMNYITGVNPTGYCYITGIGTKSPMNIHHRPSGADNIVDPVPGFLVGGPNTNVFTDCPGAKNRSKLPALSFVDELCSYSTNEICINWNTPLVFLAGALSAK
jgi:endoglucanase